MWRYVPEPEPLAATPQVSVRTHVRVCRKTRPVQILARGCQRDSPEGPARRGLGSLGASTGFRAGARLAAQRGHVDQSVSMCEPFLPRPPEAVLDALPALRLDEAEAQHWSPYGQEPPSSRAELAGHAMSVYHTGIMHGISAHSGHGNCPICRPARHRSWPRWTTSPRPPIGPRSWPPSRGGEQLCRSVGRRRHRRGRIRRASLARTPCATA